MSKTFAVSVVSTYPPDRCGVADYAHRYNEAFVDVEPGLKVLPVRIRLESPNPFHYMVAALHARRADLVHVQFEGAMMGRLGISAVYAPLFYACLLGKKVVTTVHEVVDPQRFGAKSPARLFYSLVYRCVLTSRVVLVHDSPTIERLRAYAPGTAFKTRLFEHPCFTTVNPLSCNLDAKKSCGVDGKRVLLLFGYMIENKGHKTALEALQRLPEDVHLIIAGGARHHREAQYAESVAALVQKMGLSNRVTLTVNVTEDVQRTLYEAADVVVMPSIDCSQSLVLHNAMSYGKPVAASHTGGFRDIAEKGAIVTFPVKDPVAMADVVTLLLNNDSLRKLLGEKALAYSESVRPDIMVKRLVKIYEEVIG